MDDSMFLFTSFEAKGLQVARRWSQFLSDSYQALLYAQWFHPYARPVGKQHLEELRSVTLSRIRGEQEQGGRRASSSMRS